MNEDGIKIAMPNVIKKTRIIPRKIKGAITFHLIRKVLLNEVAGGTMKPFYRS